MAVVIGDGDCYGFGPVFVKLRRRDTASSGST
jgi:hypothetical protein